MDQSSPLAMDVRTRLERAGLGQYDLMIRLKVGAGTARRLLGRDAGAVDADTLHRALGLLGRELWHRRKGQ